jgi:hypothetical protein
MTFDEALDELRGWLGERVVLTLLPEGTVLRGRLLTLDAAGIDGALFALGDGDGAPSGVALALFRDSVSEARLEDGEMVIAQGQMTHRVKPEGPSPTCGGRRSARG